MNENNDAGNYRINNKKTTTSNFFRIKQNNRLSKLVVVLFKYLINFWGSLDLALVNFEIGLNLPWSKICVISENFKNTCSGWSQSATQTNSA